jgi:hypothetical protein
MSSKQTMKYWAIRIDSPEEIPPAFKDKMDIIVGDSPDFPYALFAPKNERLRKPAQDTLLAMKKESIWILEKTEEDIQQTCFEMQEIQLLQVGSILLNSWIKICGNSDGQYACKVINYDTVLEELFVPVIDQARIKMLELDDAKSEPQISELDYLNDNRLKDTSLKFYQYGTRSILPGQEICCSIYQPRLEEKDQPGMEDQERAPHLSILTNEELIIIQETEQAKEATTKKYSGIWTHIPLRYIQEIKMERMDPEKWNKMVVYQEGQEPIELLVDFRNRQAAHLLIKKVMEIK